MPLVRPNGVAGRVIVQRSPPIGFGAIAKRSPSVEVGAIGA
ncbi:hypothetical protein [Streptomyces venezuelae]|nr:hypothetical protein [Streptomyces venezuelae]